MDLTVCDRIVEKHYMCCCYLSHNQQLIDYLVTWLLCILSFNLCNYCKMTLIFLYIIISFLYLSDQESDGA